MMYLDLSELDTVFNKHWLWSTKRFSLAWFRREDHFGDLSQPLDESVRDYVESQTGARPKGPVRMLTNLRYFGFVFNPVSFFYCFDQTGKRVEAIIAEVNNTPWGERHLYLLNFNSQKSLHEQQLQIEKDFHVSPFMEMDYQYQWQVTQPSQRMAVNIKNLRNEKKHFDVTMVLSRREINSRNLSRILIRHPWMTGKIVAAIYFEALRLWWKKIPFVPHPKKTETDLQAKAS